jgi:hypothetical protein
MSPALGDVSRPLKSPGGISLALSGIWWRQRLCWGLRKGRDCCSEKGPGYGVRDTLFFVLMSYVRSVLCVAVWAGSGRLPYIC